MMPDFSQPLGDTVKQARKELDYTQSYVADKINIDTRTLINIEKYKGNPTMEILYPLIRTLKIDSNDIFYPEQQRNTPSLRRIRLLVEDCSEQEAQTLIPVIEAVLSALRSTDNIKIEQ